MNDKVWGWIGFLLVVGTMALVSYWVVFAPFQWWLP